MASQVLVVQERIGTWARHLRPRFDGWPLRLIESRTGTDLGAAVAGVPCPIVVIDVARRPRAALEDLDWGLTVAPEALVLVLNPHSWDGVAVLAQELGATHVVDGPVTPPAVAGLLARWLPLAEWRAEAAGRPVLAATTPEAEPWCWLPAPYAPPRVDAQGATRDGR